MEEGSSSPESGIDGQKKRKRSPYFSDSESQTMHGDSTSETNNGLFSGQTSPTMQHVPRLAGPSKRFKLEGTASIAELTHDQPADLSKVQSSMPNLPPEIWQHVFTFVPPTFLGRLFRVNSTFKGLLSPGMTFPQIQTHDQTIVSLQSQDHIWSVSRRTFFPGMPRPMFSMSEMDMWKLLQSRSCQFCGKKAIKDLSSSSSSPWSSGPGPDNVRVIWPFAEHELMFSPSSVLMPGLPYAFFTPSLNFVTSVSLRTTGPANLQLTKYFFQLQIDQLSRELDEAKLLGIAAAQEWHKGLEKLGKDRLSDAFKWEQWESSVGYRSLLTQQNTPSTTMELSLNEPQQPVAHVPSSTAHGMYNAQASSAIPAILPPVQPPAPGVLPSLPAKPITPTISYPFNNPAPTIFASPYYAPTNITSIRPAYQNSSQPHIQTPIQPHIPQPRVERNIRDVNQMKADRRAEIERRCLELEPSIRPSTLMYMDSFAAAIQIPMMLNEGAWEVLKPRLIAQRQIAEQREREQQAANQELSAKAEERRQQEAQLAEARESLNREWEEIQKPVREKINNYAEEIIRDHWRDGESVDKPNCPQFAADVLVHVRKRFFEVQASEDAILAGIGMAPRQDSPGGSRKLTLENMKWVYEAKIKPWTEHYGKELFLCSVCDTSTKFYALDAVIQHYAAKHTSSLSMGTAVVYWKAEWPEDPPFDPSPNTTRAASQNQNYPTMANGTFYQSNGPPPPMNFERFSEHTNGGYPISPEQVKFEHTSPQMLPHRPLFNHQDPVYPQSFGHQSPIFTDQNRPHPEFHGYNHQNTFQPPLRRAYEGVQMLYQPPPSPAFSPYRPYAQSIEPVLRPGSSMSQVTQYGASTNNWLQPSRMQPPAANNRPTPFAPPGQPSGIYQVQIEELARIAREVWDRTSGITGLPSAVRLKVIIHHVVLSFADKFTNEPNLALFTDALTNNSQMKPLVSLSDLTCKACMGLSESSAWPSHSQVKHDLPTLLTHFKSAHIEISRPQFIKQTGIEMPRLDWKFDMVDLPEDDVIRDLVVAPGMDNAKLGLIATVLPKYFPSPLAKIDPILDVDSAKPEDHATYDSPRAQTHIHRGPSHTSAGNTANPFTPSHISGARPEVLEVTVDNFPKFVDSPIHDAPRTVEQPRDDEYDPHRPAPAAAWQETHSHRNTHPRSNLQYEYEVVRPYHPASENFNRDTSYANTSYRQVAELAHPAIHQNGYKLRASEDTMYYRNNRSDFLGPSTALPRPGMHTKSQVDRGNLRAGHVPPRSINDGVMEDEVYQSRQTIKRERQPSPPSESVNAAEHFLNNFDSIATEAYPDHEQGRPQLLEVAHPRRFEDGSTESAFLGAVPEKRVWRNDVPGDDARSRSARATPLGTLPLNGLRRRSRSPDPTPNYGRERENEYDPRMPEPGVSRTRDQSPELTVGRKNHDELRYDNGAPYRGADDTYEEAGQRLRAQPPPITSHGLEQRSIDQPMYYRQRSPMGRAREVYAPLSPEIPRRPYPMDEPVQYAGIPPPRQVRYVDDPRYVDAAYGESVEYVRVAPRESQPPARYYVDRAGPRELPNEYVAYEEEPVFERGGQLYRRAPPRQVPQDPYQEPYSRQVRYQ